MWQWEMATWLLTSDGVNLGYKGGNRHWNGWYLLWKWEFVAVGSIGRVAYSSDGLVGILLKSEVVSHGKLSATEMENML